MVDLRRRRFFGKAATAAQIAAVALAVPTAVQAAVAPQQSELDVLFARFTAAHARVSPDMQELALAQLRANIVIFERIAAYQSER